MSEELGGDYMANVCLLISCHTTLNHKPLNLGYSTKVKLARDPLINLHPYSPNHHSHILLEDKVLFE